MSGLPVSPQQQLQADTRALVTEVEHLTGLKSNWSGNLIVGTELDVSGLPPYLGAKPWNCDIVLHQSLIALPSRYSTLIHEAFHSVSVGLNKLDFQQWRWWEEAVVEQCTRLFRIGILAGAGLPAPLDARTSYTDKVILLEALRQRTQQAQRDFYLSQLQTPLRDRETVLLQWIQSMESTKTLLQIEQETSAIRHSLTPRRKTPCANSCLAPELWSKSLLPGKRVPNTCAFIPTIRLYWKKASRYGCWNKH